MTTVHDDGRRTALVLVDPYRDFLSEGGRIWPRVREVAERVGLHQHLRDLLTAVRAAGLPVFVAPHRRYRPGDVDGWVHASRAHRVLRDNRFYEVGTFGGEWHPDFAPRPGDGLQVPITPDESKRSCELRGGSFLGTFSGSRSTFFLKQNKDSVNCVFGLRPARAVERSSP